MRRLCAVAVVLALALAGCRDEPETPLAQAAAAGDVAALKRLIALGADPAGQDGVGFEAIHWAARAGQTGTLAALLKAGVAADVRDGRNHWTPLLHAIHKRQSGAVRVLLDAGADPALRLPDGVTPLMFAAAYGDVESVRLLLARGADPAVETKAGVSALANAAGAGRLFDITDGPPLGACHVETVRALLEKNPGLRVRRTLFTRAAALFVDAPECLAVLGTS